MLKKCFYHDPKPSRQGTSKGNGSCFCKSSLITRSSGKSCVILLYKSMVTSPGMGISSGVLPLTATKAASSNPSDRNITEKNLAFQIVFKTYHNF